MNDKEILDQINGERGDWKHHLQRFFFSMLAIVIVTAIILSLYIHLIDRNHEKTTTVATHATAMPSATTVPTATPVPTPAPVISLAFTGDITLEDDSAIMQSMRKKGKGIQGSIGKQIIQQLRTADATIVNNEFCYSSQGSPTSGKYYTFRADPHNVKYLKKLGVDVACLANNHVYDYGPDAFADTLTTLKKARIQTVGAGKNLNQASKPVFLKIKGKTIAIVAASRAEKYRITPEATDTQAGVFSTYDSTNYCKAIRKAKKKADIVIAYVHWGTEYATTLEDVQLSLAKELINSGADAIIGSHTHCVQGTGFYKGKPIFYSLGNFWFNDKDLYSTVVKLDITEDGNVSASMLPCRQANCTTTLLKTKKEITTFRNYVNKISTTAKLNKKLELIKKGQN